MKPNLVKLLEKVHDLRIIYEYSIPWVPLGDVIQLLSLENIDDFVPTKGWEEK